MNWEHPTPQQSECVLTGCDRSTAWMLPWWWNNYIRHNSLKIVFADFGMSPEDRAWCEERGSVYHVGGKVRCNWFKKPAAILRCNYSRIVWLDTDCEVRGNLRPIFDCIDNSTGLAGVPDPWTLHNKRPTINTGVLAIRHGHPLISLWAEQCYNNYGSIRGDQEILGAMIDGDPSVITVMPNNFNHLRLAGRSEDALIMHWTGLPGKEHIKREVNGQMQSSPIVKIRTSPTLPPIRPRTAYRPMTQRPQVLQPQRPIIVPRRPTPIPIATFKRAGIRKPPI